MPLVIHRDGFSKPVKPFVYKKVIIRIFLIVLTSVMYLFSRNIVFKNNVTIVSFVVMVIITAIIPNLIIGIYFFKTDEFKYFVNLFKSRMFHCKQK